MRIFTLPPAAGSSSNSEASFYDSLQKVRLRQQLEMYSLGEHRCPGTHMKPQNLPTMGCDCLEIVFILYKHKSSNIWFKDNVSNYLLCSL